MSNKYWNDVDQENIDMANLILEDSVNINTDGVYQDGLLRNTQNSKTKTYRAKKQKIYSVISVVAACAILVVGVGYAWNNRIPVNEYEVHQNGTENVSTEKNTSTVKLETSVSDYDEIYKRLYKLYKEQEIKYGAMLEGGVVADGFVQNGIAVDDMMAEEDFAGSESENVSKSDKDFYDTNEQTEEVHEGDIVKTDGEYIYTLTYKDNSDIIVSELIITKVNGTQMENVSKIELDNEEYYWEELYVSGDKLIVIGTYSEPVYNNFYEEYVLYDGIYTESNTVIRIYDISSRENPVLLSENIQEGYLESSRLTGDNLYVISNHYMRKITREGCVPKVNGKYLPSDCVYLPEYIDDVRYTVITSLDINDSKAFKDNVAVAGGTTDVYASKENLYLILSGMREEIVTGSEREQIIDDENLDMNKEEVKIDKYQKEYIKEAYKDVEVKKLKCYKYREIYRYVYSTEIVKYKYDNGKLKFVADAIIEGDVEDNLSIDEEKGYLRLVTTSSDYRNSEERVDVYEGGEFLYYYLESSDSYEFSEETNNVYVLNENLKEVAHIGGLAKGERIYSARYFGDYGYFVTFEQTDPLFTVDFTNIENPKIIGELKIPGFSEYLHFYKDDKLLGLGMDADNEGNVSYVKLEMYDISDNTASQETKYVLDGFEYSESLYDYKAVMVDPEKNIIGFEAESYNYESEYDYSCQYFLFTYEEGMFKELLRIELGEYAYNVRGFYIGEYLYVVVPEEGIKAVNYVNYNSNSEVAELDF